MKRSKEVCAVTPRKPTIGTGRLLLLFSASALALLALPSVAVAQTLETCLATAGPAKLAISRLQAFTITAADVVDLADVQDDINSAIASLADNVLGSPSKLDQLCERVVAHRPEVVIRERDCAGADSVTCDGAVIFGNYQDAIVALGEDAVPQITSAAKVAELRKIMRDDVYEAIRLLVEWVIEAAESSVSPGSASDSPPLVDALQQQLSAEAQTASCLAGTLQRACGDAVGSFFDAWFNGIIEIIP